MFLNKDSQGGSSHIFLQRVLCRSWKVPLYNDVFLYLRNLVAFAPLPEFVSSIRTRRRKVCTKASDRIMSHGLARRASSNEIRFRGPARIVKDHKLLGQFSMGDRSSLLNACSYRRRMGLRRVKRNGFARLTHWRKGVLG